MADADDLTPLEKERKRDRLKRYASRAMRVPLAVRTSDLPKRAASAAVMLAVAVAAAWIGGWVWTALCAAAGLIVLWEWCAIVWRMTRNLTARLVLCLIGLGYVGFGSLVVGALGNAQITGAGHLGPPWLLIALIAVVIATDTGAYFAGRTFGGPKIAPAISPSKTWAGLFGGMVSAGVVLAVLPTQTILGIGPAVGFAGGALAAIVAQAGDFLESWMKRKAGLKDSGKLIPGHGGFFDRMDGLLAVSNLAGIASLFWIANLGIS